MLTPKNLNQGKPYLLNVWATWCPSCKHEHPFLLKLAQMGIPIYGVNYQDDVKAANDLLVRSGNPYIANVADVHGSLILSLGVTVGSRCLVGQNGRIFYWGITEPNSGSVYRIPSILHRLSFTEIIVQRLRVMRVSFFLSVFMAFCMMGSTALASPMIGLDPGLNFMKKMQGRWQRDCRKVFSAEQVVTFKTVEYTNSDCFVVHRKYTNDYQYRLGEIHPNQGGSKVFALDLISVTGGKGVAGVKPKNIVQIKDGYLYFGMLDVNLTEGKRLKTLDRQLKFYRY